MGLNIKYYSAIFGLVMALPVTASSVANTEPESVRQDLSVLSETQASMQQHLNTMAEEQAVLKGKVDGIADGQKSLTRQLDGIQQQIEKLSKTVKHTLARVEVENASGIKGLGERVAEILISRGYEITAVNDVSQAVRRPTKIFYKGGAGKVAEIIRVARADLAVKTQTRIFYIEGFVQRASRVSLVLPGSQAIVPDKALKNNVEIKVVVGKDMRALLKRFSSS